MSTLPLFAVFSNIAIFGAVAVAAAHSYWTEALIWAWSGAASTAYHTCDALSMCVLPFNTLLFWDYYLAIMVVVSSFLIYIEWWGARASIVKSITYTLLSLGVALALTFDAYGLIMLVVVGGISYTAVTIYWWHARPLYHWYAFWTSTALTLSAVSLFFAQKHAWRHYDLVHGAWHVAGALGISLGVVATLPFVLHRRGVTANANAQPFDIERRSVLNANKQILFIV